MLRSALAFVQCDQGYISMSGHYRLYENLDRIYRLDTNSRTLSDEECVIIFDSSVKESQQRPDYSRRSFSNAFSSTSWS